MKYSIVTTFNQAGLDLYGRTMVESFEKHWPRSVDLYVYTENCTISSPSERIHVRDLLVASPDLVEFKRRHANNPVANGTVAKDTGVPFKDNAFKWDAVRFSHKVFAIFDAVVMSDADWVIWLDADTKTFADVPDTFLNEICNNSSLACYLGRREKYHSECGWVAYNRRHPEIHKFMADWKNLYMSDRLFDLREFHDSFVFDVLRKQYQDRGVQFHNLSPELPGKGPGHPFIASRLGEYMDHMKGSKRKALGHSLPDDYDRNQGLNSGVKYWKKVFAR